MIGIILLVIIIAIFFKVVIVEKVHIDFASFFRRGFKKTDNQFRSFVLYSESKEKAKPILAYVISLSKN